MYSHPLHESRETYKEGLQVLQYKIVIISTKALLNIFTRDNIMLFLWSAQHTINRSCINMFTMYSVVWGDEQQSIMIMSSFWKEAYSL